MANTMFVERIRAALEDPAAKRTIDCLDTGTNVPVRNKHTACEYIGKSYNGNLIGQKIVRSKLGCVRRCLQTHQCSAAEFISRTRECFLDSKSDNLEETTHSLVDDPAKITFLL